jgi:hypothetical protein
MPLDELVRVDKQNIQRSLTGVKGIFSRVERGQNDVFLDPKFFGVKFSLKHHFLLCLSS